MIMGLLKFLKFLKLKLKRQRVEEKVAVIEIPAGLCEMKFNQEVGRMKFSWEDIKRLTINFSTVVDRGGFSVVYLARLPDSSSAAVKIQAGGGSERLSRASMEELEILSHISHPNIVRLIGHCEDQEGGKVLLLEYASNGNLQETLHGAKSCAQVLSWKRRMTIAFQLAEAMAYIHSECIPHIVHGDIKASNVLLDDQMNCKLCDFGSAKMGFSSLIFPPSHRNRKMMMVSPGYTDPHYLKTGLVSKNNDIYSFGVIVLELITGLQAFNPSTGERLTMRAEPLLRETDKAAKMVDPRLRGELSFEEAKAMAAISAMCLSDSPMLRPSASDILSTMRSKIPSVISIGWSRQPVIQNNSLRPRPWTKARDLTSARFMWKDHFAWTP